ncbi:MAG: hypothetical protein HYU66_00245 [Armatimonadetes bacterium]|nr:hypothetical protein [Armatimonadota bacterium]
MKPDDQLRRPDSRCEALALRYEVRIVPDDYLGFRGLIPAFADEWGVGGTPAEALASAYDALCLIIDHHLTHDLPLPPAPEPATAA